MSDTHDIHAHDLGAPLAGRSVIVTRTRAQSRALAEPLEALGARVLAFPVIATVEPQDWAPADAAIAQLAAYDWIVLTSANAVKCFLARLGACGVEFASTVPRPRIAVVGAATARALEAKGFSADLVPQDFRAEGLVAEFQRRGLGSGSRVLVPRALEAREILPDTLRSWGVAVDVVPVYRTVRGPVVPEVIAAIAAGGVDAVTFTSPSTFRHFRALLGEAGLDADAELSRMALASIGPVTSDAIRAAGHTVAAEPDVYTVEGLVEALERFFADHTATQA